MSTVTTMRVNEMIDLVASKHDRNEANILVAQLRKNFPEFDFIMKLDEGRIRFPGVNVNTDVPLHRHNTGSSGKTLTWYVRNRSAFLFLANPNADAGKKAQAIRNIANSLPFDEWAVFFTAMRRQLVRYEGYVDRSIAIERYKGLLQVTLPEDERAAVKAPKPLLTPEVKPEVEAIKVASEAPQAKAHVADTAAMFEAISGDTLEVLPDPEPKPSEPAKKVRVKAKEFAESIDAKLRKAITLEQIEEHAAKNGWFIPTAVREAPRKGRGVSATYDLRKVK